MNSPARFDDNRDPVFLHSRREAAVILVAWVVFMVWVVGYSALNAYDVEAGEGGIETVMGMPVWVFWGVAVPWLAANLFTLWFCFWFMADDPLEDVPGEEFGEEGQRPTSEPRANK
jgi:hypothetical protein